MSAPRKQLNSSTGMRKQSNKSKAPAANKVKKIDFSGITRGFNSTPSCPPVTTADQLEKFLEDSRPQQGADNKLVFSPVGYMPRKTIPLALADMLILPESWETRGTTGSIRIAKAFTPADGDSGQVLGMLNQFCKCVDPESYSLSWLTKADDTDSEEQDHQQEEQERMAAVQLTWGMQTPKDPTLSDKPCTVQGALTFSRSQDGQLSPSLFVNALEY